MNLRRFEDVYDFVEKNATELDAAIEYDRDLGYDYFGPLRREIFEGIDMGLSGGDRWSSPWVNRLTYASRHGHP